MERTENARFVANATLDDVNSAASGEKHSELDISRAVKALASVDWNRKLSTQLSGRINATFRWLRSSKLSRREYLRIRDKLISPFSETGDFLPLNWDMWSEILSKNLLAELAPFGTWPLVVTRLGKSRIRPPHRPYKTTTR